MSKKIQIEDQIQKHLCIWLKNRKRPLLKCFCHVPNGGSRNKIEATKLKDMGVKAGVPDLLFFLPDGKLLFLELKRLKGSLSKVQKEVIEELKERGHIVLVSNGFGAAMEALEDFENNWYGITEDEIT